MKNSKARGRPKIKIPKEWLIEKYFIEELTYREIAKLLSTNAQTIANRMKEYNLNRKSQKDLLNIVLNRVKT